LDLSRFSIAMTLYAVLAVLALVTLSDEKFRLVTLAILALFAVRTWVQHRHAAREKDETRKPM
jgi:uncharacterized membrane protein YfcA